MLVRLVKSLGFWVAVSVVSVISLGVVLSVVYWDWLQGGTDLSGNGDAVRTVALVVGGIATILLALWRSVVAERQATVRGTASRNQGTDLPEREISAGRKHAGRQFASGPAGRNRCP